MTQSFQLPGDSISALGKRLLPRFFVTLSSFSGFQNETHRHSDLQTREHPRTLQSRPFTTARPLSLLPSLSEFQAPTHLHHGRPRPIREFQRVRLSPRRPPPSPTMKYANRADAGRLHSVGVFATLTNSYAIVAIGASENFYRYATQRMGWSRE